MKRAFAPRARSLNDGPFASRLPILLSVALISAALIAYEIVLMRRLIIERWYHFGYLVISVALLGFGASGTFLALIERRVRDNPARWLFVFGVGLIIMLLAMPRLAMLLPVQATFLPLDLWTQVGWWSLYWLCALLPFLLGAMFIGAALMAGGQVVGRVYAANLAGSAAGAVGAALFVSHFAIQVQLWPSLALTLLGLLLIPLGGALASHGSTSPLGREFFRGPNARRRAPLRLAMIALLTLIAIILEAVWLVPPQYDQYKYAARLQRLADQGSARRIAARADPHGYVELYASPLFHDLPFVSLMTAPPPMYRLLINGDPAGSVLRIDDARDAEAMSGTLMAFPYELIPQNQNVLLLGEAGGANIWLARRQHAASIDAVQPNAAVIELLEEYAKPLFKYPRLRLLPRDPRAFLDSAAARDYDLIQIVSLEGLGLGGAGMRGLAEDHLATVEGFADCLRSLSDQGLIAISRGIQQPPRENVRIFATLVAALESLGVEQPGGHMVQVRDYLGVCTMALKTPLEPARRQRLRAAIRESNLTPVWYDGITSDEVNQPDVLPGPADASIDWLHYAAAQILSPRRERFYEHWLLNVRPPRDDRPFFWDFYKPGAIDELKRAYGDLWLTRAELGRLFLYASLIISGIAAVVLILLPLGLVEWHRARGQRPERRSPVRSSTHQSPNQSRDRLPFTSRSDVKGKRANARDLRSTAHRAVAHVATQSADRADQSPDRKRGSWGTEATSGARLAFGTVLYFAGIGLGFMAIEMVLISRAIHSLGDPVIASALVIGGVLLLSGVGSLTSHRLITNRVWAAALIVACAALALRLIGWRTFGDALSGPWILLAVAIPAAYLMGVPMPAGLAALDRRAPHLVPWAWGVNGVASVIATSAAIVVAMIAGYRTVVLLAAGAYAAAALAAVFQSRDLRVLRGE